MKKATKLSAVFCLVLLCITLCACSRHALTGRWETISIRDTVSTIEFTSDDEFIAKSIQNGQETVSTAGTYTINDKTLTFKYYTNANDANSYKEEICEFEVVKNMLRLKVTATNDNRTGSWSETLEFTKK